MSDTINNNAITAEQLAALGLTEAIFNGLPDAAKAALIKGLKPTRAPKMPEDLWSNTALLPNGNDHSKAMCALALLLRDGVKEDDLSQNEWTRATLALIIATRAYRPDGKLGVAEASTRTAVGQARRWREVVNAEKLMEKTKRVELDGMEKAMFEYYKSRSLWPGKKDDADKRMSVMACDLLREEWRKNWTADNSWKPCSEDQPEDNEEDNEEDNAGGEA